MVSELEGLVVRMSAPKGTILLKMRKKTLFGGLCKVGNSLFMPEEREYLVR